MTTRRTNDRGFLNMLRVTRAVDGHVISTGIFEDAVASRSAIPGSAGNQLAFRYAANDQGFGRIPQRETLLPAMEQSIRGDSVVREFLALDLDRGMRGITSQIRRARVRLAANVKRAITALRNPPKQQSTINAAARRYGGNRANPLIVTAEMRNAVDSRYM